MSTRVAQITNAELDVLWRTANGIAKSRRFKDVKTPEDAFARILVGRDLGMTPTDAIAHVTFIDESPVIAAEVQAALLRNFVGPDGERYDYDVVTPADVRDTECHIEIKRRDAGRKNWKSRGVEVFTLEDAKRAELTGNEYWRKWPRRMLFARALTTAIATYAPETVHPQLAVAEVPAGFVMREDLDRSSVDQLPDEDPLKAEAVVPDRVEDPDTIRQPQVQHIREIHDYLEDRGELQRLADTLSLVGAPERDELIQRVMQLDENQASEVITRLAPRSGAIRRSKRERAEKEDRARREVRERRAPAGEQVGV